MATGILAYSVDIMYRKTGIQKEGRNLKKIFIYPEITENLQWARCHNHGRQCAPEKTKDSNHSRTEFVTMVTAHPLAI